MWQQLRESELEKEKAVLIRQLDELRGEVAKLSSENESLHAVSLLSFDYVVTNACRALELQ